MNKRRLSYGLVVTLAASDVVAGFGDATPAAETAPQPSAAASAEPAPTHDGRRRGDPRLLLPSRPPPPPKPAKEKFIGNFTQDFSGDVAAAADVDAKKKAGKNDKGDKKYNAALDKAKGLVALSTLETAVDGLTWSVNGKPVHAVKFEIVNGNEPGSVTVKFSS